MMSRKWLRTVMMCVVLCVLLGYLAEMAYAANADLEEKKGIEGLFNKKSSKDDPRAPNGTQKFVGIGSFVVMIIVVKYL